MTLYIAKKRIYGTVINRDKFGRLSPDFSSAIIHIEPGTTLQEVGKFRYALIELTYFIHSQPCGTPVFIGMPSFDIAMYFKAMAGEEEKEGE